MKKIISINIMCLLFCLTITLINTTIIKAEGNFQMTNTKEIIIDEELKLYEEDGIINNNKQKFFHIDFNPFEFDDIQIVAWAINENGVSGNVKSTILQMAQDYEKKHPGSIVLGGINADYFAMSSTKYDSPFSAQVLEGDVHQVNVFSKDGYGAGVIGINKNNEIISSLSIQKSPTMYLEVLDENSSIIYQTIVKTNQTPYNNETSVYFGDAIGTNISTKKLFVIEYPDYVRPNAFGKGKVSSKTTNYNLNLKQFAIETNNHNLEEYLDKDVTIRVQYHPLGEFSDCDNVIGYYGQPLKNGEILENGKASDGKAGGPPSQTIMTSINPRTCLGVKEDGSIVMGVIDGRQASKNRVGVTSTELAQIYKQFGCVDAYMFDGGGSTTLVARINNELKLINSPSDGTMRKVTNGIFIVKKPKKVINVNPKVNNITTNSFDLEINPEIEDKIQLKNIWAIINDEEILIENNKLSFSDLPLNSNYHIQFKYEYVEDNINKTEISDDVLDFSLEFSRPLLEVKSNKMVSTNVAKINLNLNLYNNQLIEANLTIQGNGKNQRFIINEDNLEIVVDGLIEGNSYKILTVMKYRNNLTNEIETIYGEIIDFECPIAQIEQPKPKNCKFFGSKILMFSFIPLLILIIRRNKRI